MSIKTVQSQGDRANQNSPVPRGQGLRRRTRVVGAFPDGNSALMLAGARLRHITTTKWGTKPYLATCNLYEEDVL